MTTSDEEYRSWRIPAGTVVFGNAWAILHDPSIYPAPGTFNPERYLLAVAAAPQGHHADALKDLAAQPGFVDGQSRWAPRPNAPDPHTAAFGFGRRICPGIHLADQALFLSIASVLASFEILPTPGRELKVCSDTRKWMTGGYVSYPKEFSCTIRPRHSGVEELMKVTTGGI
jgi:cytochrome P450